MEERNWKFSPELVYSAIVFMRACREEIGSAFADEKVNAMMDAFDPELKGQIFMQLLLGDIGVIVMKRQPNYDMKKINAIKAVRRVTGWGLKESKEFVDNCSEAGCRIEGSFSLEQIQEFREEIAGTGFTVS